jgi:hypothetical protein
MWVVLDGFGGSVAGFNSAPKSALGNVKSFGGIV